MHLVFKMQLPKEYYTISPFDKYKTQGYWSHKLKHSPMSAVGKHGLFLLKIVLLLTVPLYHKDVCEPDIRLHLLSGQDMCYWMFSESHAKEKFQMDFLHRH